jgi:TonB family protein
MSLKDQFNQVLLQAIRDISIADRIILDTGDGVAMGFLGDPEDALYVAMFMHDAINRDSADSPSGSIEGNAIRIGINVGPVKLATGAGGHPNIVGDGVNVAERIMGFAEPGQLTASRPVFEIMSRISDHYATLFQYTGVRTDKQARSHDVYLVGKSAAAFRHAEQGVAVRAAQRAGQPICAPIVPVSPAPSMPPSMAPAMAPVISRVLAPPAQLPGKNPSPAAAVAGKAGDHASASAGNTPEPVQSPSRAVDTAFPAPVPAPGERNRALIDFLEDRNKVAISATLLVIIAVTLSALLAYRKMSVLAPAIAAPAVAALSPAPVRTDRSVAGGQTSPALPPAPEPAFSAGNPVKAGASTAEAKYPTTAANAVTPPASAKPAPASAATATAIPAKAGERLPLPGSSAVISATVPDKPKEARIEAGEPGDRPGKPGVRDEIRSDHRKLPAPRPATEREKGPAASSAPIMPTYQSPAEAPRPALVAPTQSLPPPVTPAADTEVVILSRSAPPYPVEGIRQGIPSGVVRARITIDANGNVSDVVILESRPISAFGRETRLTAKQWKYNKGAPGRIHEVEITFKP